ncbi:hypothetical protein BC332_18200 [Capsicum chinense]|nr:hypothetical protein BC332_18200 [Capsicum chinense]
MGKFGYRSKKKGKGKRRRTVVLPAGLAGSGLAVAICGNRSTICDNDLLPLFQKSYADDSEEDSEDKIKKLAEIIPLCLQACDFYNKKEIDLQNHSRYKDKDYSDLFDVIFEENLPQQPSGSLDCGLFMVTYAERLSYGHKVIAIEFDPNTLRTRYAALLWDYEIRKQEENAHSDVETPLRPAK